MYVFDIVPKSKFSALSWLHIWLGYNILNMFDTVQKVITLIFSPVLGLLINVPVILLFRYSAQSAS